MKTGGMDMRRRQRRSAPGWLLALVAGSVTPAGISLGAGAPPPDISGTWLPVPELATPWPSPLPLTDAARKSMAAFDPDRDEPAGFCMPLGTPRNTLAFAGPLEVLQKADRVYFVFQPDLLNAETRRVYLDGRPLPPEDERVPTWLGTSRGRWNGQALEVTTTDIEPQAILNGEGLRHSGGLVVRERWQRAEDPRHGRVLVNELVLEDAASFTAPLTLRRVFVWAPQARPVEGRCSERLWIDTLWRSRLQEHAEQRRKAGPVAPTTSTAPTAPAGGAPGGAP